MARRDTGHAATASTFRTVLVALLHVSWLLGTQSRAVPSRGCLGHAGSSAKCPCHVAVVSTYPPKRCGIATFTRSLLGGLEHHEKFMAHCTVGVIAISDPKESPPLSYAPPVVYDMAVGVDLPSQATQDAAEWINSNGFTHVIIQQEFGLTPIMWQLAHLVGWLDPRLLVYTVVHTPRAYPNTEERGLLRQFARHSEYLVALSWHGVHSLEATYGISKAQVIYIPHGVEIPAAVDPEKGQMPGLTVQPDDLVIFTNGMIHEHKGLDRIMRALPAIVAQQPRAFLLIVGQEHQKSQVKVMPGLLQLAETLGVAKHVLWLDQFITLEQLEALFVRATLYITLFDEITPTSGTLSAAMSRGLPIVSTPYRYALECLRDGRGLIVPFDDTKATADSIIRLLNSPELRQQLGAAAKAFAASWGWDHVSAQYADLVMTDRSQPLDADPFAEVALPSTFAEWTESQISTFDGQVWSLANASTPEGMYAIYIDTDLQINAQVSAHGVLQVVGIRTPRVSALAHIYHGMGYEYNPAISERERRHDKELTIDAHSTITLNTHNAIVRMTLLPNHAVVLRIDMTTAFAHPVGVLGETVRLQFDKSVTRTANGLPSISWPLWRIDSGFVFSHESKGQSWSVFGISSNVYMVPESQSPFIVLRPRLDATRNISHSRSTKTRGGSVATTR
ncbi:hypothetical protein WJX72_005392 [[Myrmecia] bisecta]|uniref:Glycosyl transferase family 1 domain-containing protein n=1 Tax=[Myrmecia] bisecta TaxID=41462 RepID=A0AAW1QF66_9CHLO